MKAAGIRGFRRWFGSRKEEFNIVGVSWKVGSGGFIGMVGWRLSLLAGGNRNSGSFAPALKKGFGTWE